MRREHASNLPVLILWILTFGNYAVPVESFTSSYFLLEGDCPGPSILFVRDSVKVSLTSNHFKYRPNERRRCTLTFQSQNKNHHLLLHWNVLPSGSDRKLPRIILRDGADISSPTTSLTLSPGMGDHRSYDSRVSIMYEGHPYFDFFKITVTEIRSSVSCTEKEFLCMYKYSWDNFCISDELVCDGENNCGHGHGTDEDDIRCLVNVGTTPGPTQAPIPVALVGALLAQPFIVVILVAAFFIIRRRYQRRALEVDRGPDIRQRAAHSSRLRFMNEYVTLPRSRSGGESQSSSIADNQRQVSADSQRSEPNGTVNQASERSGARTLPPVPHEPNPARDSEVNYVNLRSGQQHLPLLFQVPDINSVPLFHTTGLRRPVVHGSCVQPTQGRTPLQTHTRGREPLESKDLDFAEVSISEPGYMEIEPLSEDTRQNGDQEEDLSKHRLQKLGGT